MYVVCSCTYIVEILTRLDGLRKKEPKMLESMDKEDNRNTRINGLRREQGILE